MVTNNIRDLATGSGLYAFLLNPQGRILGDLYAYNRGESIIVDTDRSQSERILATFDHYIIMDDVEVKDVTDEVSVGVSGPRGREVLTAAGFAVEIQPMQMQSITWQGIECSLICGERGNWEIWVPSSSVKKLWDALLAAGAHPVGFEALEVHRIESGIPAYGVDIRDRDLPQETEQARALNFNKGCYVGQEIVERIRSRGAVHRKFTGFVLDGTVAPGSKVVSGGKEVGELTSVAELPIGANKRIALGYIRREVGTPGRQVMVGSISATVVQLPLMQDASANHDTSLEQRPA